MTTNDYSKIKIDGAVEVIFSNEELDGATHSCSSINKQIIDGVMQINAPMVDTNDQVAPNLPKIYIPITTDAVDLSVSNGANVVFPETLTAAPAVKLEACAGRILIKSLFCTKLTVDMSSGAQIDALGFAQIIELKASSGSQFHGRNLLCNSIACTVHSGATMEVSVNKYIEANAPNGDITYYCTGNVEKKLSGRVKEVIVKPVNPGF